MDIIDNEHQAFYDLKHDLEGLTAEQTGEWLCAISMRDFAVTPAGEFLEIRCSSFGERHVFELQNGQMIERWRPMPGGEVSEWLHDLATWQLEQRQGES